MITADSPLMLLLLSADSTTAGLVVHEVAFTGTEKDGDSGIEKERDRLGVMSVNQKGGV